MTAVAEPIPEPVELAEPVEGIEKQSKTLSAAQFAELMGISYPTIERHKAAGLLPAPIRFGRTHRWDVEEVLAWMRHRKPDGRPLPQKEWTPIWKELLRQRELARK